MSAWEKEQDLRMAAEEEVRPATGGRTVKYVRQKRVTLYGPGSGTRHAWIVYAQGDKPRAAAEFHCQEYEREFWVKHDMEAMGGGVRDGRLLYPSGIEIHYGAPFYRYSTGPNHTDCTVLGGRCWSDGTSLGASEFFNVWGGSDEQAFQEAERWLRRHLESVVEEAGR